MPDLADFADELGQLVREFLDADVDREEIKQTLAAKAKELDDEGEPDEEAAPEDDDVPQ